MSMSRRKAITFSVQISSCVSSRHTMLQSIRVHSSSNPKCSMKNALSWIGFTMRKTPDCMTKAMRSFLVLMLARAPTMRCRVSSVAVEMSGNRWSDFWLIRAAGSPASSCCSVRRISPVQLAKRAQRLDCSHSGHIRMTLNTSLALLMHMGLTKVSPPRHSMTAFTSGLAMFISRHLSTISSMESHFLCISTSFLKTTRSSCGMSARPFGLSGTKLSDTPMGSTLTSPPFCSFSSSMRDTKALWTTTTLSSVANSWVWFSRFFCSRESQSTSRRHRAANLATKALFDVVSWPLASWPSGGSSPSAPCLYTSLTLSVKLVRAIMANMYLLSCTDFAVHGVPPAPIAASICTTLSSLSSALSGLKRRHVFSSSLMMTVSHTKPCLRVSSPLKLATRR
mmetsp:Transcript_103098/g.266580  ORF Transcript_103098/g.266580 Transcript_103098/m.266580 type:complete len:395 (+) Transcript_103098:1400-2584(+)